MQRERRSRESAWPSGMLVGDGGCIWHSGSLLALSRGERRGGSDTPQFPTLTSHVEACVRPTLAPPLIWPLALVSFVSL